MDDIHADIAAAEAAGNFHHVPALKECLHEAQADLFRCGVPSEDDL